MSDYKAWLEQLGAVSDTADVHANSARDYLEKFDDGTLRHDHVKAITHALLAMEARLNELTYHLDQMRP